MCSMETVVVDTSGNNSNLVTMDTTQATVGKVAPDSNNNHQRNPNRRSNKPIMEKRRRARINNCLNELKGILLEAMRKDPARHSKLEKADILELTVSHLKSLHNSRNHDLTNGTNGLNPNTELLTKYRAGFSECISEISRFLSTTKEGFNPAVTNRLMNHLNDCLNTIVPIMSPTNVTNPNGSIIMDQSTILSQTRSMTSPCSQTTAIPLLSNISSSNSSGPISNNETTNGTISSNPPVISLLPSRLPSGEIAFVVPGFTSLKNGIHVEQSSPPTGSHHLIHQQTTHYQPLLSPGEVPLELTVPSSNHIHLQQRHGGSTSSPTSSTSSLSPAYSYVPTIPSQHQPSSPHQHYYHQQQYQQPLALVTPKREYHDLSCWRPW